MTWLARLLAGLFGRPTTQAPSTPAPTPAPTGSAPQHGAPVSVTEHPGKWGRTILVQRHANAPDLFVRHLLPSGQPAEGDSGKRGAQLYADVPAARFDVRPGSRLQWRLTGTDENDPKAWHELARY